MVQLQQYTPWGTQLGVAAFVAVAYWLPAQTQEEHGVPPNSHWGTQLGVVAFVAVLLTKSHKRKKSVAYPEANLSVT